MKLINELTIVLLITVNSLIIITFLIVVKEKEKS